MLAALPLAAQQTGVRVTARNAADNSLAFDAAITGYGTFTIRLAVADIRNHAGDDALTVTVTTGNEGGEILSIAPQDAARPVTADFSWDWINGTLDATPDLGFIYRLPIAAGKSTTVRSLTPAEAGMMRDNIADFRMWEFTMERDGHPCRGLRRGERTGRRRYDYRRTCRRDAGTLCLAPQRFSPGRPGRYNFSRHPDSTGRRTAQRRLRCTGRPVPLCLQPQHRPLSPHDGPDGVHQSPLHDRDGQRSAHRRSAGDGQNDEKTVGCRIGPNEFLGTGIRPLMQKKLYERSR